jgi:hypothetical protein
MIRVLQTRVGQEHRKLPIPPDKAAKSGQTQRFLQAKLTFSTLGSKQTTSCFLILMGLIRSMRKTLIRMSTGGRKIGLRHQRVLE